MYIIAAAYMYILIYRQTDFMQILQMKLVSKQEYRLVKELNKGFMLESKVLGELCFSLLFYFCSSNSIQRIVTMQ